MRDMSSHSTSPLQMNAYRIIILFTLILLIFAPLILISRGIGTLSASSKESVTFAALGDWGCSGYSSQITKMVEKVNPNLVLGLGDYVFDNNTSCFFDMIEPVAHKMKIAFGKHDVNSPSVFQDYMKHFGLRSQYYSYDFENVHFTVISTEIPFRMGYPQYDFVKADLERASKDSKIDWLVVYFHRPVYTSASFDVQKAEAIRETYHPLFDAYNVDLVLQAHNHYYQRTYPLTFNPSNESNPFVIDSEYSRYEDPNGTIFLTVGTGGGDLHHPKFHNNYVVNTHVGRGFMMIEIDLNSNELNAQFYSLDGKIIDNFTIGKSIDQRT